MCPGGAGSAQAQQPLVEGIKKGGYGVLGSHADLSTSDPLPPRPAWSTLLLLCLAKLYLRPNGPSGVTPAQQPPVIPLSRGSRWWLEVYTPDASASHERGQDALGAGYDLMTNRLQMWGQVDGAWCLPAYVAVDFTHAQGLGEQAHHRPRAFTSRAH